VGSGSQGGSCCLGTACGPRPDTGQAGRRPWAVGVQWADDAVVAGTVEARITSAVSDSIDAGRSLAIVGARQSLLRNTADWAVEVLWTYIALRVEAVVAVRHPAGVVGVGPSCSLLTLLTDHVA
jgi:hypothetical protein